MVLTAEQISKAIGMLPREPVMRRALRVDPDEAFFVPAPPGLVDAAPQDFAAFAAEVAAGTVAAGPVVLLEITERGGGGGGAASGRLAQTVREFVELYTQLPTHIGPPPRGCAAAQLRLHRQPLAAAGGGGVGHSARSVLEVLLRSWPAAAAVQLGLASAGLVTDGGAVLKWGLLVTAKAAGAAGDRANAAGLVQPSARLSFCCTPLSL